MALSYDTPNMTIVTSPSGSKWNKDHLTELNIKTRLDKTMHQLMDEDGKRLNYTLWLSKLTDKGFKFDCDILSREFQDFLENSIGYDHMYMRCPHYFLEVAAGNNGALLTSLAAVTMPRQPVSADAGVVQRYPRKVKPTLKKQQMDAASPPETPVRSPPVMAQQTPRQESAERAKPEIAANMLGILFSTSAVNSARRKRLTGERTSMSREPCLEWKEFPISIDVTYCEPGNDRVIFKSTVINDGSLVKMHLVRVGREEKWVRADNIVYSSLVCKKEHDTYDNESGTYQESLALQAQHAAEMIAVVVRLMDERKKREGEEFDPQTLTEAERTVFLVSFIQTAVVVKWTTFSLEYLQYFNVVNIRNLNIEDAKDVTLEDFLKGRKPNPKLEEQVGELSLTEAPKKRGKGKKERKGREKKEGEPEMIIYRTSDLTVRDGYTAKIAASLLAAVARFLEIDVGI